jgi:hypothetical protein
MTDRPKEGSEAVEPEEIRELDPEQLDSLLGAAVFKPLTQADLVKKIRGIRLINTLEIDPGSLIAKQYDR